MTHGTGSASLVRAMGEQVPHLAEINGSTDVGESPESRSPSGIDSNNGVGQHRLSGSQREQAIELAELLEIDFQAQGRFIEAAHAAYLRTVLVAGRCTKEQA